MDQKIKLKKRRDRFLSSRGGAHFLDIYCGECSEFLLTYQKDGSGNLFRMYLDRIIKSPNYRKWVNGFETQKELPQLKCLKCKNHIGSPMLYAKNKEFRLAYRLVGPIKKSKNPKGIYPPEGYKS